MSALKVFLLFSMACLALPEQPSPKCKLVTVWGVTGCETAGQQPCAKGYHKQQACPANPMIKAPCRMLCVLDVPKDVAKKGGDQKKSDASPQP
jgi:hypothetical protein